MDEAERLYRSGYVLETRARDLLRAAMHEYERAVEVDPTLEKAHHQLIFARAALMEAQDSIELYVRRHEQEPANAMWRRCLAHALLRAGAFEQALGVLGDAGDAGSVDLRAEAFAALGRPQEALAEWSRALELDPDNLGPRYGRAFLLERLDRVDDAVVEWETLIATLHERGWDEDAEWPERELARLRPPS